MTERQTRSAREQGGVCGVSASPHFRAGIRESVHDPLTCTYKNVEAQVTKQPTVADTLQECSKLHQPVIGCS